MAAGSSPYSMFTTYLPDDFEPSCNEVKIGRGKKILAHSGNVKLRSLVQLKAKEYCTTTDKTHKSFIISEIGNQIKKESEFGGFVKQDTQNGKWYVVSESCVRATIAQCFRDFLSPNYRSSKFSKQQRRWSQKTTKQGTPNSVTPSASSNSVSETVSCGVSKSLGQGGLVQPLNVINLQRMALHTPAGSTCFPTPLELPKPSHVLSSPESVAEQTSNILKKCLQVLDSDDDDWILYSDNPFEPNPIAEKTSGSANLWI